MPRFSITKPTKNYPNWDFWFENKPSGNPGRALFLPTFQLPSEHGLFDTFQSVPTIDVYEKDRQKTVEIQKHFQTMKHLFVVNKNDSRVMFVYKESCQCTVYRIQRSVFLFTVSSLVTYYTVICIWFQHNVLKQSTYLYNLFYWTFLSNIFWSTQFKLLPQNIKFIYDKQVHPF
jgi:hypothetical protein